MKEIKLPTRGTIEPTPGKPISIGIAMQNREAATENRKKVIDSSLGIESEIDNIIALYFFSGRKDLMRFFSDVMLKSSFLGFMNKAKVLKSIFERNSTKQASEVNQLLKRVISYRNAFAHGEIIEKSDGTYIRYFKGEKIEKKLDDTYWTNLEEIFKKSVQLLQGIRGEIMLN